MINTLLVWERTMPPGQMIYLPARVASMPALEVHLPRQHRIAARRPLMMCRRIQWQL